ncbi:unnamed protein product [Camellia sinensis]
MSRRRIYVSSIIGRRRRRIADHNSQKGTINPGSPPPPAALITKTLPTFRCNGLQDAVTSFNCMIQMRPLASISHFNKALGPLLKMGHYDIALPLIGKLHFLGIQVNSYTFNIAINCYCHLNQVSLGSLFWVPSSNAPDVTTLNTLLNGLILDDKIPEAVELFKKLMKMSEIEPNVIMCGTIVNGLYRTENTIRAVRLLRIMEEGSCKPDTVVYNH